MPSELASELSLFTLPENGDELEKWCLNAIEALPEQAIAARKGNTNVLNRLVGHVMKTSRGRADAKAARSLLQKLLNQPEP